MELWRVEYIDDLGLMKHFAVYVQAYTSDMAKAAAYTQVMGKEYSVDQRDMLFTSIKVFGEY